MQNSRGIFLAAQPLAAQPLGARQANQFGAGDR